MTSRDVLVRGGLAALGALVLVGCTRQPQVALKVEGGPGGEIKPEGVIIRLAFDHPMAKREATGRALPAPPARLTPDRPGTWQWSDERTLLFVAAGALPRATTYVVEVPAGTVALDGARSPSAFRLELSTPRPKAWAHLVAGPGGVADSDYASRDQRVELEIDQPTRVADVRRHCRFEVGERTLPVEIVGGAGEEAKRFLLRPEGQLPVDAAVALGCDAALSSAEGPRGLKERLRLEFHTYGPFKLVKAEPEGMDVDSDDVGIAITLSTPVAERPPRLTITPPVAGFPDAVTVDGATLRFYARSLDPNTGYKIVLPKGLKDIFGQTLGTEQTVAFRTGRAGPRLDLETGAWVVESSRGRFVGWQRNVTKLEVVAAQVPEAKLGDLFAGLNWWDDEVVDLAKLKIPLQRRTINLPDGGNHWRQLPLAPADFFPAVDRTAPTGFYYFGVTAPETASPGSQAQTQELLVNFTNLGVTSKLAASDGLVFVTRLDTGEPADGAEINIVGRDGKSRWRGRTGADGVARTPGRSTLLPRSRRGDDEGGDDEGEDHFEGRSRPDLLVYVRLGKDVTWVNPSRPGALATWNYNVSVDSDPQPVRLRGFLHSDRGLYRPGETVHLRGLARTMRLGEGLRLPSAKQVAVEVRDPRGQITLERKAPLSPFGGFAFDVALPADARLGDWQVTTRLPEGTFREHFSVEEFRPAAFEVKAKRTSPTAIAGDTVKLEAEARYFYGSPVRRAKVTWSVHSRYRPVSFPAFPDFVFDDQTRWERDYDRSRDAEQFSTEEEKQLDREGRGRFAFTTVGRDVSESRDYLVEVGVEDETHQRINAHLVVPVAHAGLHFGVDVGSPVAEGKTARRIKVVAVDPEGRRLAAKAKARLVLRRWSCTWGTMGFWGSYSCKSSETEVDTQPVEIGAQAPAEVDLRLGDPGEYLVIVEGQDDRGRAVRATSYLYGWARDCDSPWRSDASLKIDLVADRKSYRPGDTAKLLVKSPFKQANGLLTIERQGILEARPVRLQSGAATLDVPLTALHAPNVYVSLFLARGRNAPGPRGTPSVRMGVANLEVASDDRRLAVTVKTDRESYRPGEQVTATVEVKDGRGQPVQAEVALAAADEGILSLINFKTPDPLATFYAPWGLGVETATQYERIARLPEPGEERNATGGDGAGRLGTLRSRFLANAYWNPSLVTDGAGRAEVRFQAPENLTAFRVMAVVADAGDRFGSGDRRFTVRKPLQLLGAYPRFLAVGDQARGAVVVINETGQAGSARVEAEVVGGAKLTSAPKREVTIPANGRLEVPFTVEATRAGKAELRFAASLGGERDGLLLKLPVKEPGIPETTLLGRGATDGEARLAVALPPEALERGAEVTVAIDPLGMPDLADRLRGLIRYPYGCLEQTTSRLIPLLMVEELARSLKLEGLDGAELQHFLRAGLGKLGRFQHESGGFTLWEGGQEPEVYLTAYALWGLHLAKQAGHPVDETRLAQGATWLRRALAERVRTVGVHNELGELGSRAFALYVLAELGRPEPGFVAKLLEQKGELPRFGLAFLARAMARSVGPTDQAVQDLVRGLKAAVSRTPTGALVSEPSGPSLLWYFSSDARTTAIVTDALIELAPDDELVAALVRSLTTDPPSHHGYTTQENLYTLVALTHWAKGRSFSPVEITVGAGDTVLATQRLKGTVRFANFTLPYQKVAQSGGTLSIRAQGGKAFYAARLRYHRPLDGQKATALPGLDLAHEYLDPATGEPVKSIRVGDTILVRLHVDVVGGRTHLALVEPIPAGFEIENQRFATATRRPRLDDDQAGWYRREYVDEWSYRQLHDDRAEVFLDYLWDRARFELVVRATTAGRFARPAALFEEMYRPEAQSRTVGEVIEIGEAKRR